MTNHGETTGSPENGDISRRDTGPRTPGGDEDRAPRSQDITCTAYDSHGDGQQVTLRSPAELADALPYLLGYRPEDSIVLVALHDKDGRGRFGGRARLGIPANPDDWPSAARQLAHGLVTGSERRGARPEQMVVFLCHEPGRGESGRQVKERLGPLARTLRLECGALDIPVVEALCVSDGRFWSYWAIHGPPPAVSRRDDEIRTRSGRTRRVTADDSQYSTLMPPRAFCTASRVVSSISSKRWTYTSSVTDGLAWPSRFCTVLIDSRWAISSEA